MCVIAFQLMKLLYGISSVRYKSRLRNGKSMEELVELPDKKG